MDILTSTSLLRRAMHIEICAVDTANLRRKSINLKTPKINITFVTLKMLIGVGISACSCKAADIFSLNLSSLPLLSV